MPPDLSTPTTLANESILGFVQRLKEQILEKDRILNEKTSALLATRDYLRGVFSALTDAVLVVDPTGRIESANDAAVELLGYSREELLGRQAARLWGNPSHAALFQGERFAELLEMGTYQRTDMVLLTRRGEEIPVSWSSAALRIGDVLTGLVGIARDVRVERRVEAEKIRAIQALAASVAHEIRNPLGAIQNSVGLLRRDLQLEGDDATLMEIVYQETQRIGHIVTQFLEFARPPHPAPEVTDLAKLLQEVVTLAEQDERARAGKELLLLVDPSLAPLSLDPDHIKQVVWNLISNALDAAHLRIAIRVRATQGGVEVRVADDGPGMPPELLQRACEPFHTTKAQGTGLGLSVCHRLITAHGGTFRLLSALGSGTTAAFTLPVSRRG